MLDERQSGGGPVVTAGSVREVYAHIARQRCHCGSPYTPEAERVANDTRGGTVTVHVLMCRCLNRDCRESIELAFRVERLLGNGLGRAVALEAIDPLAPGNLFPELGVPAQAAIHLLAAWLAYRATGLAEAQRADLVRDVCRHLGIPPSACEHAQTALASAGRAFDDLEAALTPVAGGTAAG